MGDVRPAWKRWVPGSAILLFFALSAGLWLGALVAWEVRQPALIIGLLVVGAFVPVLWLALRTVARPLWALEVTGERRAVADAVRGSLLGYMPTGVPTAHGGPSGLFRDCELLVRIERPACLIAVRRPAGSPRTLVLLLTRSHDREGVASVRDAIAHSVSA